MTQDGKYPRNDAHGEAHTALYALMAGAEGCGPAERTARLAQDDELADFLLRVQAEVSEEAGRLLAERVAEWLLGSLSAPDGEGWQAAAGHGGPARGRGQDARHRRRGL